MGSVQYTYDPLGQLDAAEDSRGGAPVTDQYTYINGRTLARNGESDTDLHFDDPLRPGVLAGMSTGTGPRVPVVHDADGNITALPGRAFTWNAKSELARVDRTDGTLAEYVYDHRGSRVRKTVQSSGLTTDTVLLGDVAEIRNGQVAFFVALGRQRIAVVSAGTPRWIHTDQLGSATFFTDAAGNRIARIAYRPFGNAPGTASTADQVFALHAFDAEAGLYAMRRRYYDPVLGRFLSADGLYLHDPERAITDPRRFALYTYVGNDPVNNIDPTGNTFWSVLGAIVGVVVGVIAAVVLVAALAIGFWAVVLVIAAIALVMVIGYVLASNANPNSAWGQFLRGFFLGMNAGLNAGLLTAMGAPVLGIVVGVVLFLGAFDKIANNEVYQGIIGWGNWVMPTSWPIVALGAVFFILNALPWIFTFGQVGRRRSDRLQDRLDDRDDQRSGGLDQRHQPMGHGVQHGQLRLRRLPRDVDRGLPRARVRPHAEPRRVRLDLPPDRVRRRGDPRQRRQRVRRAAGREQRPGRTWRAHDRGADPDHPHVGLTRHPAIVTCNATGAGDTKRRPSPVRPLEVHMPVPLPRSRAVALVLAFVAGFLLLASNAMAGSRSTRRPTIRPATPCSGSTARRTARSPPRARSRPAAPASPSLGGRQGAVELSGDGRYLYAVNAGSDSVSVFRAGHRRTRLIDIVSSRGVAPASVAEHRGRVYVLNSGGTPSVAAFRRWFDGSLKPIPAARARSRRAPTAPRRSR